MLFIPAGLGPCDTTVERPRWEYSGTAEVFTAAEELGYMHICISVDLDCGQI